MKKGYRFSEAIKERLRQRMLGTAYGKVTEANKSRLRSAIRIIAGRLLEAGPTYERLPVHHIEPDLHPEVTAIQDKFLARYGRPGERPYGERLRLFRVAMKMSADALSEAIGVPVQQVRSWEGGNSVPDTVDLMRMASVLSVPLNWVEPITISKAA